MPGITTTASLCVFDSGYANRLGSKYTIKRGDTINSFSIDVAHLPPSNKINLGFNIAARRGRRIYGAIWVPSINGNNVNVTPKYISSAAKIDGVATGHNYIDTDTLPSASIPSEIPYKTITFEFNNAVQINATNIIIGIYSDYDEEQTNGSIAFLKLDSGTIYYSVNAEPEDSPYINSKNGIATKTGISVKSYNISVTHSQEWDSDNLKLRIGKIQYRTLSSGCKSGSMLLSSNWDLENPISNDVNQRWNKGFDFNEGKLKDVYLNQDNTPIISSSETSEFLWVHSRSRIMINILPPQNISTATSISYVISETGYSSGKLSESKNAINTLLLCPRDMKTSSHSGIGDNEPMTVTITRWKGNTKKSSITLYFHTFASSEVSIAYPKNIKNVNGQEVNYALWANEVVNNMYIDTREDSPQICSVLNMLLTQSGGDNSGLPIYTRVNIQEFKGEYGSNGQFNGTFNIPSNNQMLSKYTNPTAIWQGVFKDNGKIIQLTGMDTFHTDNDDYEQDYGITWDTTITRGTDPSTDNWEGEYTKVTQIDLSSGERTIISDNVPLHHALCVNRDYEINSQTNIATETLHYREDARMCFRSGYKYLINVRRFHSACAGAIEFTNTRKLGEGGSYIYDNQSEYPGAVNAGQSSPSGRYPRYDTDEWLDMNNNRHLYSSSSSGSPNIHHCKRWWGPDGGVSGTADSQTAFPGFSQSDYIIIDCVSSISSNSNVTVTRPAVQEVGADHWITFGYKHLNKVPNGMDIYGYGNLQPITNTALSTEGRCDTSKADYYGYLPNTDPTTSSSKSWSGWSGNPTTSLRTGRIYFTILWEVLKHLATELKNVQDELRCQYCGEDLLDNAKVKVWIDHQGHKPNTPIYEYDDFKKALNYEISSGGFRDYIVDGGTNVDDTHLRDFLRNVVKKPEQFKTIETFNGEERYLYSTNGEYEIIFDPSAEVMSRLGNEYRWFSVINGCVVDNINKSVTSIPSITYQESAAVNDNNMEDIYYTSDIDLKHGLRDVNSDNDSLSVKGNALNINADVPSIMNEWNHSGVNSDSDVDTLVNALFTSKSDQDVSYSDGSYSQDKEIERTSKMTGGDGVQYFSSGKQTLPGKLYKRVPPEQDCENGYITTDWRPIPSRRDISYPIVRTTHLLFYRTFVFGSVVATMSYTYYEHTPQYDEEGEYSGCASLGPFENTSQFSNVTNSDIPSIQNIGITRDCGDKHYNHVIRVFGEDNGGLGRCLSSDDYSNLRFSSDQIMQVDKDKNGGLEIPIRVRYTPCAQPSIIQNSAICGQLPALNTTRTNNVISVLSGRASCSSGKTIVIEDQSTSIDSNLRNQESFHAVISYGMFRSAMGGQYYSYSPSDKNFSNSTYNELMSLRRSLLGPYNTDTFPSLGICNAFTVILIPTEGKLNGASINYTKQSPNWFANRLNYEDKIVHPHISKAKPTIVADIIKTDVYKLIQNDVPEYLIDHKLRTLLDCEFNYKNLLQEYAVNTSTEGVDNRHNLLQPNVWYDLVVVPVFTTRNGFGSDSFSDMTFQFENGAGTITYKDDNGNDVTVNYAQGAKNQTLQENYVDYYGSNPLVIRKFLNIAAYNKTNSKIVPHPGGTADVKSCGGGGGGKPDPEAPKSAPFKTEGAIVFPNVNNVRYNRESGWIKECPGFWLNNTFRVMCRAPHYRTESEIKSDIGDTPTLEMSLEAMTGGELTDPRKFVFSDVMIHIGGYWNTVKVWDEDNQEWVEDLNWREWTDDQGYDIAPYPTTFNSPEFQKQLDDHSLDKEWLNIRGIYSIRNNSAAFSKRVPDVKEDESRELIKGGGLDHTDVSYKDRFFEFNPSMVNARTPDAEGYYMQVRFLNSEYPGSAQNGKWTEWCGGILNDTGKADINSNSYDKVDDSPVSGSSYTADYRTCRKDAQLQYYVPVRNYNLVYTGFRSFLKDSALGSNLVATEKLRGVSTDDKNEYIIPGSATQSPNQEATSEEFRSDSSHFIRGTGNFEFEDSAHHPESDTQIISSELISTPEFIVDNNGSPSEFKPYPDNTDHPYPNMITKHDNISTSGISLDADYSKPAIIDERHQNYWEMSYIAYVLRNMAKLYYSEWEEAIFEGTQKLSDSKRITPANLGWNAALAMVCPNIDWDSYLDADARANMNALIGSTGKKEGTPLNTDEFYRKIITAADFDSLLETAKKLVDFIRLDQFTGTKTATTDTKSSDGSTPDGYSVFPTNGQNLEFDKLYSSRMIIGHSLDMNDVDKSIPEEWSSDVDYTIGTVVKKDDNYYKCVENCSGIWSNNNWIKVSSEQNQKYIQTDSNYLQQLSEIIFGTIIQDSLYSAL